MPRYEAVDPSAQVARTLDGMHAGQHPGEHAGMEAVQPPPKRHRRQAREHMNLKVLTTTRQRLDAAAAHYDATLQDLVDAALDRYLTGLGFGPDPETWLGRDD